MNDVTVSVLGVLAFEHALLALALAGDSKEQDLPHPTARVSRMLEAEAALLIVVAGAILLVIHLKVGWL